MKRASSSLQLYSPYVALALFLVLVLTTFNYLSLASQQTSLMARSDQQQKERDLLEIELSEKNERLKTVELNNKELQKNEADLFKCLEDKAVLEIIENEKNSTRSDTEKLSREELLGNVTSLTRELSMLRGKMQEMNVTRAELGRTIMGLRARVESYSQWDRAQAEKAYGESLEGEVNTRAGNVTVAGNSTDIIHKTKLNSDG